jgi:hypothetical protein
MSGYVGIGDSIPHEGRFEDSDGVGVDDITVVVDIMGPAGALVVTGGACTGLGDGTGLFVPTDPFEAAALGAYTALFRKTAGAGEPVKTTVVSHFLCAAWLSGGKVLPGALANDSITAAALATSARDEIADRVSELLLLGVKGTVGADATTTSIPSSGADIVATNDWYNSAFLMFTSGDLNGLGRLITDYVGAGKTFTTQAFPGAPAEGDTFLVLGNLPTSA